VNDEGERKDASMTTATIRKILLHGCPKCHGSLFLDVEENEYTCLQCGRAIDARRVLDQAPVDALLAEEMSPTNRRLQLLPRQHDEVNDDAA
jgi:hypothetical protein